MSRHQAHVKPPFAILEENAIFGAQRCGGGVDALHVGPEGFRNGGREQLAQPSSHDLIAGHTKELDASGIDVFQAGLAIQDEDDVLGGFGERPIALLALLERCRSFFDSSFEFGMQARALQRQRDLVPYAVEDL